MKDYTVKIAGLSAEDVKLCELLWNDRTGRSIVQIIIDLPRHQQSRAWTLQSVMMAEVIDQIVEEEGDYAQARDILSSY